VPLAGHVFISHGSDNREEANELSAFVESRGVKVWIAPRDVRPGMDYSEELQAAIEACAAFVVLVTDMANKSPYVRAETEMAFSNSKPIFPVRLSDIKPAAGLAFFLKIRHWTDAYGKSRDASMERLALELQTLCGTAPAPDPEPAVSAAPTPAPAAPAPAASPEAPSPPAPPPAAAAPPALPADEDRLAAAIGPKAAWYLERWRLADAKKSIRGWNWAACLLSIYWLAYRKMWQPLAVVGAAFAILSLIGAVEPRLGMATFLLTIAITFVTGTFGNHLYRKQVTALAADPSLDRAGLEKRGGVSMPALWGTIGATLVLVLLMGVIAIRQMPVPPAPPPAPAPDAGGSGGDKPVDGGGQAGNAGTTGNGGTGAAMLDRNYLVGRWTDDGNCDAAFEFTADGRFITAEGGAGLWDLQGSQLTMSGPGGTQTMQAMAIDRNTLSVVGPDGTTGSSQRC